MLVPKSSEIFECKLCDYKSSRKSQYDRHISTSKHKNQQSATFCQQKSTDCAVKSSEWNQFFACNCGKEYKDRSGLWRHKKKCMYLEHDSSDKKMIELLINDNKELRNFLVEQAKDNCDFKTIMMEVLKNGTNHITNTNCMNDNKTFNLNFFLNETCKDAMNINQFVDSIKLQLRDLERFGEIGYVEGLSNIITNNLKALDVRDRPVHCTDKKREIIYIKDEDKWEKEDDNKTKLRRMIKNIACKNYKLLPEYKDKYPGCQYADSKYSDTYNKMVVEVMGGNGNENEKEDKIIRNISKNIVIEKQPNRAIFI
jgi:hypothetical protein